MDEKKYLTYGDWKGWTLENWGHFSKKKASEFRKLLGFDPRGLVLLEYGFGGGAFICWARQRGAFVSGVELQDELLSFARGCGFPVFKSIEESFVSEPFDVICAFDVLEHLSLDEIGRFFEFSARSLAAEGILCIKIPNGACPFSLGMQHGDVTHRSTLTKGSVEQVLAQYGLRVASCRPHSAPLPGGFAGLRSALQRLLRHLYRKVAKFMWDLSEDHFYQCIILEIRRGG